MEGCLTRRPNTLFQRYILYPAGENRHVPGKPPTVNRRNSGREASSSAPGKNHPLYGGRYQTPDRRLKLPTCSAELTRYRYLTAAINYVKPQFLIHYAHSYFKRKEPPRSNFLQSGPFFPELPVLP